MVVSDRVHETVEVSVPEGGTTVSLPVKAEWGAGAYLVATAYRPLDQAAKRLPGRALGLAWFSVDRERRSLGVAVKAPERARPAPGPDPAGPAHGAANPASRRGSPWRWSMSASST